MTIILALLALFGPQDVPAPPSETPPAQAIMPGTIAIRVSGADDPRAAAALAPYVDAVENVLLDRGFTVIPGADHARYIATVAATQQGKGAVAAKGRGGGSSMIAPLGAAVGGGMSIGLGGGRNVVGELVETGLDISIARRGVAQPVWQGRAVTHQVAGARGSDAASVAGKLAAAMFRIFPQGSGQIVSVP